MKPRSILSFLFLSLHLFKEVFASPNVFRAALNNPISLNLTRFPDVVKSHFSDFRRKWPTRSKPELFQRILRVNPGEKFTFDGYRWSELQQCGLFANLTGTASFDAQRNVVFCISGDEKPSITVSPEISVASCLNNPVVTGGVQIRDNNFRGLGEKLVFALSTKGEAQSSLEDPLPISMRLEWWDNTIGTRSEVGMVVKQDQIDSSVFSGEDRVNPSTTGEEEGKLTNLWKASGRMKWLQSLRSKSATPIPLSYDLETNVKPYFICARDLSLSGGELKLIARKGKLGNKLSLSYNTGITSRFNKSSPFHCFNAKMTSRVMMNLFPPGSDVESISNRASATPDGLHTSPPSSALDDSVHSDHQNNNNDNLLNLLRSSLVSAKRILLQSNLNNFPHNSREKSSATTSMSESGAAIPEMPIDDVRRNWKNNLRVLVRSDIIFKRAIGEGCVPYFHHVDLEKQRVVRGLTSTKDQNNVVAGVIANKLDVMIRGVPKLNNVKVVPGFFVDAAKHTKSNEMLIPKFSSFAPDAVSCGVSMRLLGVCLELAWPLIADGRDLKNDNSRSPGPSFHLGFDVSG